MNPTMRSVSIAVVVLLAGAGCGRGGSGDDTAAHNDRAGGETAKPAPSPSGGQAAPEAPTGATVTLSGTIHLEGTPPPPIPIQMSADAVCSQAHADTPPVMQDVVVSPDGMLANVFVFVRSGLEGKTFPTTTQPVELDQKGCMYVPHVLGMMVNQPLKLLSSDPTLHNVHSHPTVDGNKEFNLAMVNAGSEVTRTFAKPEIMIPIKCDVHPWMVSYIGVVEHPFFAVSDAAGHFSIPNLPPGTYTIETWHEKFGARTQTVTLGETPAAAAHFTYKVGT
jgi:hypothetical protein